MVVIDESSLHNLGAVLEEEVQEEGVEESPQEESSEPEIQRVKVGEQEYTSDELSELVGLGSRAKEIGDSHGGFDKFVSEYGRKSERIGEYKKQLEELERTKQTGEPVDVEQGMREAQSAARKLGIVLKDDLDGYYQNRRGAEKLLETCSDLEISIDGTDGRPKFDKTKVLEFMEINPGFTEPERAYKAMHVDEISDWKASKTNIKPRGINTETSTNTNKVPVKVSANRDNLHALIAEQMSI